jgi:hypothetical protein
MTFVSPKSTDARSISLRPTTYICLSETSVRGWRRKAIAQCRGEIARGFNVLMAKTTPGRQRINQFGRYHLGPLFSAAAVRSVASTPKAVATNSRLASRPEISFQLVPSKPALRSSSETYVFRTAPNDRFQTQLFAEGLMNSALPRHRRPGSDISKAYRCRKQCSGKSLLLVTPLCR